MRAQMSGPPPSPQVGTKEDPAKALDGLLSMMEFQVVGAAKAMPADKYSFAPTQGIFAMGQTTQFDTVRTFVAQVTHLAQANYFFFGWSGIKPDRDLKAIGSITTKDEAVAALEASYRLRAQGNCNHYDRKCICRHQAGRRVQHAGYDCRFCSSPRE